MTLIQDIGEATLAMSRDFLGRQLIPRIISEYKLRLQNKLISIWVGSLLGSYEPPDSIVLVSCVGHKVNVTYDARFVAALEIVAKYEADHITLTDFYKQMDDWDRGRKTISSPIV